jgi:UDP-N-acetylglucosamine acyltransferase
MVGAHIGHDCTLGDEIIMANAATLAGHVVVEDHATIGAYSGVSVLPRGPLRLRRRIFGDHEGRSALLEDCQRPQHPGLWPEYDRARAEGFTPEQMTGIKTAFRLLLQSKLNTSQAVAAIREKCPTPEVEILLKFIETSERGVIK